MADLTVVLFHGYGANAADLAPLADALRSERPISWVFPEGPLPIEDYPSGRCWWPIDMAALQAAQLSGRQRDLTLEPAGLPAARRAAGEVLKELDVPWDKLVLGGFSQGAMLAADLALRAPEAPRGLALLSGTLVNAPVWKTLAAARRGMPFFQSHGRMDPILPFGAALKLEALLCEAGLKGRLHAFDGGHGIPSEVLEGLSAFLASL